MEFDLFLSPAEAERVRCGLDNLTQSGLPRFALTGSLAMGAHFATLGMTQAPRRLNDMDMGVTKREFRVGRSANMAFAVKMTPCASTHRRVYVEGIGMAAPSKFELPQGTLDLLVLRVVAHGPVHGYAIAQQIQMISKEALQVQQGSLYPALHRLENKNFLAAEWGLTETGREAKFYRLTAKGRTQLKTETESWERLTEVVAMILQHPLGEPS